MKKPAPTRRQVRIFVSYAHADPSLFKTALEQMLRWWGDIDPLVVWTDKDIIAGTNPDKHIRAELERMDIFIALISPFYGASSYCNDVEADIARRRCKKGKVHVVPIVIDRPCGNDCEWLMGQELLPDKKDTWADIRQKCGAANGEYDLAIRPIREGLRKVIDAVLAKKPGGKRATP